MIPLRPDLLVRDLLRGRPDTLKPPDPAHLLPRCTYCGHPRVKHRDDAACRVEGCHCQAYRAPECARCDHPRLDHPLVQAAANTAPCHGPCTYPHCACGRFVPIIADPPASLHVSVTPVTDIQNR